MTKNFISGVVKNFGFLIWFVAALFYGYEFFHRVAPSVMSESLMRDLDIHASTLGSLSAYYFYAYAAAQVPAGVMLDYYGLKKVLSTACLLVAMGSALFSGANSAGLALFSRVIIGFGSAFAFVGCLKIAAEWFSDRWFPVVVGLTNTLGVMGALAGEAPLSLLVEKEGWRSSMMLSAFVGFFLAGVIYLFVRDTEEQETECKLHNLYSGFYQILKSPYTWMIATIGALRVTPVISFAELWAVPFFKQSYGISPAQAAGSLSFIFIGIAIGGPLHGFLARFYPKKQIIFWGGAVALVCDLFLTFFPYQTFMTLSTFLFFLGFSSSSMLLCFTINREQHPRWASGAVMGFTNMVVMGFAAAMQPLIGYLLDLQIGPSHMLVTEFTLKQYQNALMVVPACVALSLFLTLLIKDDSKVQKKIKRKKI